MGGLAAAYAELTCHATAKARSIQPSGCSADNAFGCKSGWIVENVVEIVEDNPELGCRWVTVA